MHQRRIVDLKQISWALRGRIHVADLAEARDSEVIALLPIEGLAFDLGLPGAALNEYG